MSPGLTTQPASDHEHFGPIIVVCDDADIRLSPGGFHVCGETERHFEPAPPLVHPRREVIDGLVQAVHFNTLPPQTGEWGLASLEICHAILKSAETRQPLRLEHQVSLGERAYE